MNEKTNQIALLNSQLQKLKSITTNCYGYSESGVQAWICSTASVLERIFGNENAKINQIEKIKDFKQWNLGGENYYICDDVNAIGESIILTCIAEIDKLGFPLNTDNVKNGALNLTMIQEQSNSQLFNIDIINNVFQNELTDNQRKEIKEIISQNESIEKKKIKLSEKFKEFGISTLSSVVAGIITNMINGR